MAQEVRLQGRTYSDVPSILLPDSNNVFHPFTDVSDTTATASDVATGKYFYLADGTKTQGTSSGGGGRGAVTQDQDGYLVLDDEAGQSITVESLSVTQNGTYTAPTGKAYSPVTVSVSGGGGLVYETGTYIPDADNYRPTISFSNTHTDPPIFVHMADVSSTSGLTTDSNTVFTLCDTEGLFEAGFPVSTTEARYGFVYYTYRTSSSTTTSTRSLTYGSSNPDSSGVAYYRYWADESGFMPYSARTTRYWRAGRTYKWIAVWKPTT